MRKARIYQLRRTVLEALAASGSAPATFDEVLNYPGFGSLKPDRQEVLDEWNNLISEKFIQVVPESGGDYVWISSTGRYQINREGDLDKFIWGGFGL